MAMHREPCASDPGALPGVDESTQETVALLLDEIARLEAELRARDDAFASPPGWADSAPAADAAQARRIDDLTAELAGRDETIMILLEQTRMFEEAADAQRAEWEQLTRWVEEVEQRVSARGGDEPDLSRELAAERRHIEELERRLEAERKAWEGQKRRLEQEAEALRARGHAGTDEALAQLEAENRALREHVDALGQVDSNTAEVESLRQRVAELMYQADTLKGEHRRERDERARERNENEATIAALRSERARQALEAAAPVVPTPEARNPNLDPDERIRAFRQHLRELHDREAAERASRGLANRLSRLWRSTGPG